MCPPVPPAAWLACRWMSSATVVLDACQARNDSGSLTPSFTGLVTPSAPAPTTGWSTWPSEQGDRLRIGQPRVTHHRRLDLVRLRIEGRVELQPGPPLGV